MSPRSSSPADAGTPPYRRLKLVVSTSENPQTSTTSGHPSNNLVKAESSRSSSPARPSYSPVTPTMSHSSATAQDTGAPEWIDEPTPLPVSLDENPDAIALQATLSLLQMQRQQSLRDIRGLNKLRHEALEDPEAFVADLKSGKLSQTAQAGISFDSDTEESDEEEKSGTKHDSRFDKLPVAQNIARCPPIEWSKYRIAGEPLDRIHELQKQRPGTTEMLAQGYQPTTHEVVAPYRPFTDKLDPLPPSKENRNYDR